MVSLDVIIDPSIQNLFFIVGSRRMIMTMWLCLLLLTAAAYPVDGLSTSRIFARSRCSSRWNTLNRHHHSLLISNRHPPSSLHISTADSAAPTTDESIINDQSTTKPSDHYDAVIVGGGPAGLLSAIMLAQKVSETALKNDNSNDSLSSSKIIVYDRLPPPPPADDPIYSAESSKYYLLGLGHRGQRALRYFDVWDDVEKASVAVYGRRGWEPGKTKEEDGKITLSDKAVTSRILPRDKLVSVLKRVVEEKYGDVIELRYGYQVDPISFGNEEESEKVSSDDGPPVTLQVSRCIPVTSSSGGEGEECSIENDDASSPRTIQTNFLIGADGAARTIANAMEENDVKYRRENNILKRLFGRKKKQLPFKVTRYYDDNPRVYKSVPVTFPKHWPFDLNYSARSTNSRVTFEALPSDANGNYCALLLMRPNDTLASANCDPKILRSFFEEEFSQFSKLINDDVMADVAKKGASSLPSFRYAGPRLHMGSRTVLLGDSIHTVKP